MPVLELPITVLGRRVRPVALGLTLWGGAVLWAMLADRTLSGPEPAQAGALIELTQGGKLPVTLSDGSQRTFLQDGDEVVMRGWCEAPGAARIGFGECRATILPAIAV